MKKNLRMFLLVCAGLMLQAALAASTVRAYTVYTAVTTCANFPSPYGIAPMPGPQDYPLYCMQNAFPTGGTTPTATPAWFNWVGGSVGWTAAASPAPTSTPTATASPV